MILPAIVQPFLDLEFGVSDIRRLVGDDAAGLPGLACWDSWIGGEEPLRSPDV